MGVTAKNPILRGFYPDPSICVAGEDFYMVNSTFAYFPGLPLMHSRDLVHWEQIGNVMERNSQLPLGDCGHSAGLYAPTIRYYKSVYYVICTNVSGGGNFIVTATRPQGPWSEPHYLEGAAGIDPSLFFDEDGKAYYVGMCDKPEGPRFPGDTCVWIQELDLENWRLCGEPAYVWYGALRDIDWVEGPHLYKKDGWYYIMHAEGGTGPYHSVVVCRSRSLFGPYENNFCNPILTHRHLGKSYPVQYVGHADMVETPDGEWYMVMLAVRPLAGYTRMGRETFLAKVSWENDWPVVNPGEGRLTETVEVGLEKWLPEHMAPACSAYAEEAGKDMVSYDFGSMEKLPPEFLFLRNPKEDMCRLQPGNGLLFTANSATLKDNGSPAYAGIRQSHQSFLAETEVLTGDFLAQQERGVVGMALLQSNEYHLRMEASGRKLQVLLCEKGTDTLVGEMEFTEEVPDTLKLYIEGKGLFAEAGIIWKEKRMPVAQDISIKSLSTEVAQGFVGCTIGMYASLCGEEAEKPVVFKRFSYEGLQE